LSEYLARRRPDLVLAQGDTTTVFCAALACYYHRVPFAHVEAGLRTGHPYFPFPEEKNRVLTGHLADVHFAPTVEAGRNLRSEGIAAESIHITGNTVIDALLRTANRDVIPPIVPRTPRYLLVTAHRRETSVSPFERSASPCATWWNTIPISVSSIQCTLIRKSGGPLLLASKATIVST